MDRSKYMRAPDAQLNLVWWLDQIALSPDEAAVMTIVTQFIAAWPSTKIHEMPVAFRPGRLASPDDVSSYATALVRAELGGVASGAPQVHAMYMFFADASARLSRFAALRQRQSDIPRLYISPPNDG